MEEAAAAATATNHVNVGAARGGGLRSCGRAINQGIYSSTYIPGKNADILCMYFEAYIHGLFRRDEQMTADERGDHDPCVHPPLAPCLCDSECHWGGLLPAAAAEAKRRRFCQAVSFETACSCHELLPPSTLGGDTITAEEAESTPAPEKRENKKKKKNRGQNEQTAT